MINRIFFQKLKGIKQEDYAHIIHNAGGIDRLAGLPVEFWQNPENVGKNILSKNDLGQIMEDCKRIEEVCQKGNIKVISCFDMDYPILLREIPSYPKVLYCKGTIEANEKSIAIVGSRNASSYGHDVANQLAYELARSGVCVVSGVARGIDTFSHLGALNAKGRTIGVLGCGVNYVYPPENKYLYERIADNGAVISEYEPDVQPKQGFFPARNRIISGMSVGTLVVEAGIKSGSLITAGMAMEYGREVFAVPGDVTRNSSAGVNNLIKDGAIPVFGVNDITNVIEKTKMIDNNMKSISERKREIFIQILEECDDTEKIIVSVINNTPEMSTDFLVKKTGIDVQILNAKLILLELKGIIEKASSGKYRLAYIKKYFANFYTGIAK